jgi:hypothetical protein
MILWCLKLDRDGDQEMSKPQDFSFSIERDDDIGTYFQFYYHGSDDYEDVWDDLEDIIEDNLPNLLDRVGESSYEHLYGIDTPISKLKRLGFTEKT